ncbi:CAP domain-containing protein [Truncatella angustata]|uniref:CAP domain-containing protein n=1 Tax=Truncatella angustata TaxID=152316 RepID=A0A9P9A1U5_9PEZI|nr:CAP domain-containing protein [Truncatella angustata]KAH6658698.1 CAP domain-containing protein [Truncatella angustata]KAH8203459.1 hypothetical protein TruAng_002330 [Truncatella angustata]
MRFSTGLTFAAALLGVDACAEHSKQPSRHHTHSVGASSSAAASPVTTLTLAPSSKAVTSLAVTTSLAAATTFSTQTKSVKTISSSTSSAAAATSTTASSSGLTDDQQNALDAQNSARSDVGSAALVWDADLAAEAQTWAEHLVSVGDLVHSDVSNEGENLYMGYDSNPFVNAANLWIDEKSSYSGEVISETNYMTFGHYTQIVWSSTTNVGMGSATDSNGAVYVVARYSPPGNMIGEAAY